VVIGRADAEPPVGASIRVDDEVWERFVKGPNREIDVLLKNEK
jgi:hypothetical protein